MDNPLVLALRYLLGQGFFYDVFLQARPLKWEVCEMKLGEAPAGDGWEPFSSNATQSDTTYVQWRRPA